jgi:hypothetical protein
MSDDEQDHGTIGGHDDPARKVEDMRDEQLESERLREAQEHKGYGDDEGEREESLPNE